MAWNTKTPTMDFSPFLRRDFSTDNRGGALADAFRAVGTLADGYGETADKELMSKFANETDATKIEGADFYNKLNALNAKKIIDQNKDRVYKDEQVVRQNDLNARADADYAIGVFNKEVANDVLNMPDRKTFDAKYLNAGGVDGIMVNNLFNQKEDRLLSLEDKKREAIKDNLQMQSTNLQMQNTRNQMNRQNEEYNYNKQQRAQNDTDNKFINAFASGYIPESELETYRGKVSDSVFNGIVKQQKMNNITNNYATLQDFRNSEEWKTTPIEIKNEIFKSKIYEQPKSTYQEKLEQDYISDIGEMSAKLGTDNLANVDYTKALADGKVTQNDLTTYTYKLSKSPSSKEVDKKMITGDFGVINQKANQFSKAFNNPKLDTGITENLMQQAKAYLPDMAITNDDLANAEFRSSFNGFAATLLKIQSGATVTDKERATFYDSLGTLSKNKKINAVGVIDKLSEAEARFDAVKSASPEYFNIKYGSQLNNLKKSKAEIENYLYGTNQDKKSEVKVIGNNVFSNSKNSSTGNNNDKTPVTTPIILTDEQLKNYGISFK